MESSIPQGKIKQSPTVYHFVSTHAASIRDKEKREFSGAGFCDPGPSFARCEPIENSLIVNGGGVQVSELPEVPSQIIFKIETMADAWASCTVGLHTNVNDECFFDRKKNRIGHEVSVHGHRVREMHGGRRSEVVDNIQQAKNREESEIRRVGIERCVGEEWADGDIIKLIFANPILSWYWNGIKQSSIDVSEENDRIVTETLNGGYQVGGGLFGGKPEYVQPKWCFYARGVCMKLCIQEEDLSEEEYEELRKSYPDRYKIMKDNRDEEEKNWEDDWW